MGRIAYVRSIYAILQRMVKATPHRQAKIIPLQLTLAALTTFLAFSLMELRNCISYAATVRCGS